MPSTIDQYREAKTTYLKLREQAKKDLLARFNQLANEMFQIQKELRDDFGHKIGIPAKPSNSRLKKTQPREDSSAGKSAQSPKISAIEKKITLQKQKLDDAQKASKPVQTLKDRLYELEDELRLARENA